MIEQLAELEIPSLLEHLDGFYCPSGLDLGGEGPEAIALSVLAEIQAVLNGREGSRLSMLNRPIHDTNPSNLG